MYFKAIPIEKGITIPVLVSLSSEAKAAIVIRHGFLPAAGLHEVLLFDGRGGEAFHRAGDGFAGFGDDLGIVEVGGCDDDGLGARDGFFALDRVVFDIERCGAFFHEDAGAYEDGLGAELHHQGGIGGGGNATCGEVGYGEFAGFGDHPDELVRSTVDFGGVVELLVTEDGEGLDLADDLAHVLDGVDDVAGAGFALGTDHGCAFGDAAEGFAEVAGPADEGGGEGVLVDVVDLIGGGKDFGLIDEVDAELLEYLGLGEVADASLSHNRDGDRVDDLLYELGICHAGYAAFGTDHGRYALEGHDGDGASFLGNTRLLDVHDVHDDSTFKHLGQTGLEAEGRGTEVAVGGVVCHDESP
jgi:hypothetical protein